MAKKSTRVEELILFLFAADLLFSFVYMVWGSLQGFDNGKTDIRLSVAGGQGFAVVSFERK
jgi:hypothetical protein